MGNLTILNLTQHPATPEQRREGVIDPPENVRAELVRLLTFKNRPDMEDIWLRAEWIAALAKLWAESLGNGACAAMIGGAPYLMPILAHCLLVLGIEPLYAFTKREVKEEQTEDGSVHKVAVFRHEGFIWAGAGTLSDKAPYADEDDIIREAQRFAERIKEVLGL